jgi:hypothetical protein
MPQGLWCSNCNRQTLHVDASKVNHLLHFLVGLLTCTLWWFVWAVGVATSDKAKVCGICGTRYLGPQKHAAVAPAPKNPKDRPVWERGDEGYR